MRKPLDSAGGSIDVKLLRLRLSAGEQVPFPSPTYPLGGPLRAGNFGPTLESVSHLLAVRGR